MKHIKQKVVVRPLQSAILLAQFLGPVASVTVVMMSALVRNAQRFCLFGFLNWLLVA